MYHLKGKKHFSEEKERQKLSSIMCAAVDSESNKKKIKQKSMLGYCNNILNRIVPSSSKSILKTDAVPTNDATMQITSNGNELNNENITHNLTAPSQVTPIELRHSLQMIQNNLNQDNQHLTVIESQQNLNFNNVTGIQFGNTFHVTGSSSRKNSYNGSYDDKANNKKGKTRSLIGKHVWFPLSTF